MPLYEYRCSVCGAEFDVIQKISDEDLATMGCDRSCVLTKIMSVCSIKFNGSGFYENDYKGKK